MERKTEIIEVPVTEKWTLKRGINTGDIIVTGPANGWVDGDGRGMAFGSLSEIPEQVWKRAEELYREGQPVSGEVAVTEVNGRKQFADMSEGLWGALSVGRYKITVERLD